MHKATALSNPLNLGPPFAGCYLLALSSSLVQPPLLRVQVIVSNGDPQRLPESILGMNTVGTQRKCEPWHPCQNELTPLQGWRKGYTCKLVQLYRGQFNSSCEISVYTSFDARVHFCPADPGTYRKGCICQTVHCRAVCKSGRLETT